MKKSIVSFILALNSFFLFAQTNEEKMIKEIYKSSLTNSKCYSWLDHLSNQIGSRLSGSASAEKAVQYTREEMETMGFDRVFLQEVMVPKWVRGEKETAYILDNKTKINLPICALGGSIATSNSGLTAEVIEVQSLEELATSLECDDAAFDMISSFAKVFEPYLIHSFVKGHSGAEIGPLTSKKIVKAGLKPDSQRYFDYHHAANDKFDAIDKRELELGAATMASLMYLMDQNGIEIK